MPSAITPTLSAAASQVLTPQTAKVEAQAGAPTAAQLAQLSQEAAQRTTTDVRPDPERTPQVPKKVEAGYTAQSVRKKKKKDEEDKDETKADDAAQKDDDRGPVDVVA